MLTMARELGSQGLRIAPDGTAAYVHVSTVPSVYYMAQYGSSAGMNMDRGGFGQSAATGLNYGAIFDGVSVGGAVNVYAAQHFAQYILERIHDEILCDTPTPIQQRVDKLLSDATHAPSSQVPRDKSDGGSAVGALVWFSASQGEDGALCLRGAAIGDAAVLLVQLDTGQITQLNKVSRLMNSASDSGGQLAMGMGVIGNICHFECSISGNSCLVLLVTDGLTDNLASTDMVAHVISNPFFDTQAVECGWDQPQLPVAADLQRLGGLAPGTTIERLRRVSPSEASTRLAHYVEWVTHQRHLTEVDYYQLELQYHQLMRIRHSNRSEESMADVPAAAAEDSGMPAADCLPTQSASTQPAPTSHHASGGLHCQASGGLPEPRDVDAELEQIRAEMKSLKARKVKLRVSGKTDDAMVIALSPFNSVHQSINPRRSGRRKNLSKTI